MGVPSELLERRPDIAAAERLAAAANAQIGVAKAAYFPTFTLAASGGYGNSTLSNFFSLPNRFWSLGPALLETLFDGGRRRALSEQAWASYDAAVAESAAASASCSKPSSPGPRRPARGSSSPWRPRSRPTR